MSTQKQISNNNIFLPSQTSYCLSVLRDSGYEAYVVGGSLRDMLLGLSPLDFDITTSAPPEKIQSCFQGEKQQEIGFSHGSVTVWIEKQPMEITTFRKEGPYQDHRHPSYVAFTTSLEEDLLRRDFTVNAMAYHPEIGLIDPFHGKEDLEKRLLRAIGNPFQRFDEDALRILRALRFASVYQFTIEPQTEAAIFATKDYLKVLSVERIQEEMVKLLQGPNATYIMTHFSEVMEVFIDDIFTIQPKQKFVGRLIKRLGPKGFFLLLQQKRDAIQRRYQGEKRAQKLAELQLLEGIAKVVIGDGFV